MWKESDRHCFISVKKCPAQGSTMRSTSGFHLSFLSAHPWLQKQLLGSFLRPQRVKLPNPKPSLNDSSLSYSMIRYCRTCEVHSFFQYKQFCVVTGLSTHAFDFSAFAHSSSNLGRSLSNTKGLAWIHPWNMCLLKIVHRSCFLLNNSKQWVTLTVVISQLASDRRTFIVFFRKAAGEDNLRELKMFGVKWKLKIYEAKCSFWQSLSGQEWWQLALWLGILGDGWFCQGQQQTLL